jgi:hypothetical protein
MINSTTEISATPDSWPGVPSPLEAVADMRTTAKWIIGAAAATGATLLGGAPLAAVGKIHGVGSAALAFGGLVIGLTGVGWAIWHTAEALIPPATSLATLEQPQMEEVRTQIAADPMGFFGPFGKSVPELEASCRRFDIAAAQVAVMLAAEPDPNRQRILAQGMADASANAARARARLRWLLALAHAWQVRHLLYRARLHAFVGAAAVAFGAVLFIVATSASTSTAKAPTPATHTPAASTRTIAR